MKTTPILMQPEMVRATLREIEHPGTGKTQTRRQRGLEEMNGPTSKWEFLCMARQKGKYGAIFTAGKFNIFVASPYGGHGDMLYVRETMIADYETSDSVVLAKYAADGAFVLCPGPEVDKDGEPDYGGSCAHWDYSRDSRPSLHMPRWASRITLLLTSVLVERLQDISYIEAKSEGVSYEKGYTDPRDAFRLLWESINGAGSWDKNPFVWRLAFTPMLTNVDKAELEIKQLREEYRDDKIPWSPLPTA